MKYFTLAAGLLSLGVANAQEVSTDGSCGNNGVTCQGSEFGNCCSPYGWVSQFNSHAWNLLINRKVRLLKRSLRYWMPTQVRHMQRQQQWPVHKAHQLYSCSSNIDSLVRRSCINTDKKGVHRCSVRQHEWRRDMPGIRFWRLLLQQWMVWKHRTILWNWMSG